MTILFTTHGIRGIGDALFMTAVAHQFKSKDKYRPIAVRNKYYILFFNNPDVDLLICGNSNNVRGPRIIPRETRRLPQIIGNRWSYNWIIQHSRLFGKAYNAHHGWPPNMNLLAEVAEQCGLNLSLDEQRSLRPYFWPFRIELKEFSGYQGAICVHSEAATYWTPNKQWPIERIQRVVDALALNHRIVQLGAPGETPLQNAEYLCGKLSLRQTAVILAQARLFIGMEGGLMHLARAVDTRAVIIYTGFITPEYSGYEVNCNLFGPVERADLPCWSLEPCDCDCAERISVDQVLQVVALCLSQLPLPKHYFSDR